MLMKWLISIQVEKSLGFNQCFPKISLKLWWVSSCLFACFLFRQRADDHSNNNKYTCAHYAANKRHDTQTATDFNEAVSTGRHPLWHAPFQNGNKFMAEIFRRNFVSKKTGWFLACSSKQRVYHHLWTKERSRKLLLSGRCLRQGSHRFFNIWSG